MRDKAVKAIILLILFYLAARNWHNYIKENQYEERGWLVLMGALATTMWAIYIQFN